LDRATTEATAGHRVDFRLLRQLTEPSDGAAVPGERGLAHMPALDGVRGVAILVIIGYHGGVFLTSGGFFSLDTFFALSGYLITTLLLREWQGTGGVRLRNFWARRARRLIPGLLLMLLGVAVLGAFLVPAGTYPTLRGDGISSLLYYANWHFIVDGSNYFVQTGPSSPLTHMWSLAVEEQFYLVWPLVVVGTLALFRSRRALLGLCLIGALASAVEMGLLYSVADVNRVYYGTDTRAQSLLLGAALAVGLSLWSDRRPQGNGDALLARTSRGRSAALLLGLAGVAGSAVLWTTVSYNDAFAYRGGFFLAALATAAVLASIVTNPASLLATGLSWPPLRFIGRISYGMYLWHYPLILYLDRARCGVSGWPLFGIRLAATMAIATVSYYLIEQPIRQGRLPGGWWLRVLTPLAVAGTAVALVAATVTPSVAAKPPPPSQQASAGGTPVRVLVVGDSTALTLDIGLNEYAASYGVKAYNGGIFGCGVTSGAEYQLKGVDAPMAPECTGRIAGFQWFNLWRDRIKLDQHPGADLRRLRQAGAPARRVGGRVGWRSRGPAHRALLRHR
jgi:peptidoglycan/LPS O-acetylase OafA/YrhL